MNDLISRRAAIDMANDMYQGMDIVQATYNDIGKALVKFLNLVPSAQPEIIRCRNCKFASGDSRICMKFGHSPIGELDFCAWAERKTDE